MKLKLIKTLQRAEMATPSTYQKICGLAFPPYPGTSWDDAPTQFLKLQNMGFIDEIIPYNGVHKKRAAITEEGRHFLQKYRMRHEKV